MLDILIQNGWVADGTGNPAYPADVAIEGDRVIDVGPLGAASARLVIDAAGRMVTPGFVDAHSHTDWSIHANPTEQSSIRYGATTEIVGNCGISSAPLNDRSRPAMESRLATFGLEPPITWSTFAEYLETVEAQGTSGNLVFLLGHNTVRATAGVTGPEPTEDQLRTMEELTREAMDAGAWGLSTGLEFEPGRTARTAEIVRLARVAGEYGRFYASHMRNRDEFMQESTEEFLQVVRESGAVGQISHLNVRHHTAPAGTWEVAVAMLEEARRSGLNVLADTTPFLSGLGLMAAILPPWIKAEGSERAAELLSDPAIRNRLRTDCDRYWRFIHRGEWQRVRLLENPWFPSLALKTMPEIAAIRGTDEWDAYFDILQTAGPDMETLTLVGQLFTEEHSRDMVQHPLLCLGVDGFSSVVDDSGHHPLAHPINYAGMMHYLTHHVRDRGNLRLEEAIRKMTSMPATHFGLPGRGLIQPGGYADVLVFAPDQLNDGSTLENPVAYAQGMEWVIVNGTPVVARGEHTMARPGRCLRRG